MSRLERYTLEQRLKVPFAGSLRAESVEHVTVGDPMPIVGYETTASSTSPEGTESPVVNLPDVRPQIFPYETGEGQKKV